MPKTVIHSALAPAAIGAYSQAVLHNNTLYTSGQLGLDPVTGELRDGIEAQTRQAFANLAAVCEAAGTSLSRSLKMTIFMKDLADFGTVNAVMTELVPKPFPARSCFAVAALPKGGLIEIEAIVDATPDDL